MSNKYILDPSGNIIKLSAEAEADPEFINPSSQASNLPAFYQ